MSEHKDTMTFVLPQYMTSLMMLSAWYISHNASQLPMWSDRCILGRKAAILDGSSFTSKPLSVLAVILHLTSCKQKMKMIQNPTTEEFIKVRSWIACNMDIQLTHRWMFALLLYIKLAVVMKLVYLQGGLPLAFPISKSSGSWTGLEAKAAFPSSCLIPSASNSKGSINTL